MCVNSTCNILDINHEKTVNENSISGLSGLVSMTKGQRLQSISCVFNEKKKGPLLLSAGAATQTRGVASLSAAPVGGRVLIELRKHITCAHIHEAAGAGGSFVRRLTKYGSWVAARPKINQSPPKQRGSTSGVTLDCLCGEGGGRASR